MHEMISVEKAKKLIASNTGLLSSMLCDLQEAQGCVLTEDVIAPVDLPLFDQSAMDGYALRFADLDKAVKLRIIGEIPAGKAARKSLSGGQAMRIFTGAAIPRGADTVVMQEKAQRTGNDIRVMDSGLLPGAFIRKRGSEIRKGDVALKAGSLITAGACGFLRSMGISRVRVARRPLVSIIVTGSELARGTGHPAAGKVYECNSHMLRAALASMGLVPKRVLFVRDNEDALVKSIKAELGRCDLLLLSGGVSVGDYDLSSSALFNVGVKKIFHKVRQRPGKPLWFGCAGDTTVFALPGNSAAALTCFYEYVSPHLLRCQGKPVPAEQRLPLLRDHEKKAGLAVFLKGRIGARGVHILPDQESFKLRSFATANCLVYIPAASGDVKKGSLVRVHPLPC